MSCKRISIESNVELQGKSSYTRPARNSKVSPFLGTAKAPRILFIAIIGGNRLQRRRSRASATGNTDRGRRVGRSVANHCGEIGRRRDSLQGKVDRLERAVTKQDQAIEACRRLFNHHYPGTEPQKMKKQEKKSSADGAGRVKLVWTEKRWLSTKPAG